VTLSAYLFSRYPVTNRDYEQFTLHTRANVPTGRATLHPVVYVSSLDAIKFAPGYQRAGTQEISLATESRMGAQAARGTEGSQISMGGTMKDAATWQTSQIRTRFA